MFVQIVKKVHLCESVCPNLKKDICSKRSGRGIREDLAGWVKRRNERSYNLFLSTENEQLGNEAGIKVEKQILSIKIRVVSSFGFGAPPGTRDFSNTIQVLGKYWVVLGDTESSRVFHISNRNLVRVLHWFLL